MPPSAQNSEANGLQLIDALLACHPNKTNGTFSFSIANTKGSALGQTQTDLFLQYASHKISSVMHTVNDITKNSIRGLWRISGKNCFESSPRSILQNRRKTMSMGTVLINRIHLEDSLTEMIGLRRVRKLSCTSTGLSRRPIRSYKQHLLCFLSTDNLALEPHCTPRLAMLRECRFCFFRHL